MRESLSPKATQFLTSVRAMSPLVTKLAPTTEQGRRLPNELLREFKAAGLFRAWMPRELGGETLEPVGMMRVVEELAQADGSAGWAVMVAAQCATFIPQLDLKDAQAVFSADDILAGTAGITGRGTAVQEGDGYRANGRFAFASGCTHASWLVATFTIMEGGQPRTTSDGRPEFRMMFMPPGDCQILDTWYTTGMRGSGSNHFEVRDVFVPAIRVSPQNPITDGTHVRWGGPIYGGPFAFTMRGALALGLARHAMDELELIAATKKPAAVADTLRDLSRVQSEVARVEAAYAAARGYLYQTVEEQWEQLNAGNENTPEMLTLNRLATAYTVETCVDIVTKMFRLGGGTAIYETSSLDRCFRDANTLLADQAASPRVVEAAGRLFLNRQP
jgi:indole-3-acetate monooxygenase